MKKALVVSVGVIALLGLVSTFVLKIPPWHLGAAMEVAAGLGAKVACSARFLSGFSYERIHADLETYSPANALLNLDFDEQNKRVQADMLGLGYAAAKYRPGLGCTLEIGELAQPESEVLVGNPPVNAAWPEGNQVVNVHPGMQDYLQEMLKIDNEQGLDTRALLVLKGGKIQAEVYAPGYSADTPFLGWSMGKSLTAIMIGNLIQQGQLSLEQASLFDHWANDERKAITLRHLLTMTSGLAFDETYVPGSDSTRMLFTAPSAAGVAMDASAQYAPGTRFSYSSGTTNLLARLVFDKVGGTLQQNVEYFRQAIAKPLGLTNTTFEVDPSGAFVGSSYIFASARDWAKLALMLLNHGALNGQQVVPKGFVTEALQPNHSDNDSRYGFQLWLNGKGEQRRWDKLPEDAYAMMGSRSQLVMMVPSHDLAVVRLGWTPGRYPTNDKLALIVAASDNIGQSLL